MKWKVGDKAVILKAKYDQSFVGKVVTIIGFGVSDSGHCCQVDLKPSNHVQAALPKQASAFFLDKHLGPIYDGDEITSWEEVHKICKWKPKELVRVS